MSQVSSISPPTPSVVIGNRDIGVNGSNFQAGLTVDVFNRGGTKVGTLSGTQIQNVTANSFTMVIDLGSTAGTFGIEVVNPSGARSTRFFFSTASVTATISSLSPASPPVFNGNQNVQVNGIGFEPGLTVDVFNSAGTKLGTLSGTQILNLTSPDQTSFTMVINLGATAGTFGIEVVNPGGARSARFILSTH